MFVYPVFQGVGLRWIEPAGVLEPTAYRDLFFTKQLRAEGLNISFALLSGTLPDGLTLSPSGVLEGTPTTAQTYTFTVRLSDSQGRRLDRTFQVPVLIASGSAWYDSWVGPGLVYTQDKNGLSATIFLDTLPTSWWTTWDSPGTQTYVQDKTTLPSTITLDTVPSSWWTTWTNS